MKWLNIKASKIICKNTCQNSFEVLLIFTSKGPQPNFSFWFWFHKETVIDIITIHILSCGVLCAALMFSGMARPPGGATWPATAVGNFTVRHTMNMLIRSACRAGPARGLAHAPALATVSNYYQPPPPLSAKPPPATSQLMQAISLQLDFFSQSQCPASHPASFQDNHYGRGITPRNSIMEYHQFQ